MRKNKKNRIGDDDSLLSYYEPQLLRPFSNKNDPRSIVPKFATIDIETQDWINYVCGEVYYIIDGQEHYYETNDLHDLMLKCFEIANKYGIKDFVAHYGGKFDFLFFIKDLILCHYCDVENIIPRGSSLLSFSAILKPSSYHNIALKSPLKITFRDSSALLPFSLGKLTKSFNVETLKGEFDFLFVKKVYEEQDYLKDILNHPSCCLFSGKRQVFNVTKSILRKKENLKYWNSERFPFYKYRHKKNKLAPYKPNIDEFVKYFYPIFNKDDLLLYLHHDCKSLHQCLNAFFNAPLISAAHKKWTTASQAVEVFRLFLKRKLHSLPDDDNLYYEGNVDAFVRMAYFGGRTEIFKPIFDSNLLGHDYLYYHDINSLYPYTMAKNKYPDKFLGWLEGEADYNAFEMSIWHCKVRVPTSIYAPPLPVKREERLIFPVGEFTGYWTKVELEYARSLGCEILEYYEGVAFQSAGYIFKNFINTLYQMRLDAKEKNDNVTQMTMKLIMNSCYGRMGINKEREKILIDNFEDRSLIPISEIKTDFGIIRLSKKEERAEGMFSNPAIACFVTSYARIHLHKQFREVGEKNLYYCDTDSCFTQVPMKTGKELGMMKLEYKCKSACFVLPKTYVNEDIYENGMFKAMKLTMKGFDYKNLRNAFTYDDFIEYLNGDMGLISVEQKPKFATFKSALKMGEFITMKNDPESKRKADEWREREYFRKTGKKKKYVKNEYKISVKKLQGHYNKRTIIKGGYDTKPLLIME